MARAQSRRSSRRPPPPAREERLRGTSWWDGLSARAQHLICLALLLVVATAFYAPILFSDKALVGGDAVQWRMMSESMMEYHEATGEESLWSANPFGGMPGYMITRFAEIPQLDTVATLLRKIIWPLSHFLVLLGGLYALVVFLGGHKLAGVLGAVGFGLTTYLPVILMAGHNSKYIALCYAPWLLLAFAFALRRPRLLAGLLFAIALAVNLRAGHPQITYYALFTLGIWWIGEGIAAWRQGSLAAFGRSTGWLALGSVLAALMVAYPYLLQAEYKDYTIRGAASAAAGGADTAFDYAMAWSQGAGELLTLVVAGAYGGGGGTYWGPKIFTAGPHYVGGIVFMLAIVALALARSRALVLSLGTAVLLMVLFSLGEHLESFNRLMYNVFPLFDAFRVPETWLSMVALVLALLAGMGATTLLRDDALTDEASHRRTRIVYAIAGGAVAVSLLIFLVGPSMLSFSKTGELEQAVQQIAQGNNVSPSDPRVLDAAQQAIRGFETERATLFRADALRTFFFLLLGAGLIAAHRMRKLPAWLLLGGLALLVTIDLFGVGRRYLDDKALVPDVGLEALVPSYPFDDFILARVAEAGGPGHFRVLSLESGNPSQGARPAYFYESLNGYHGAKLRLFQDFLDHLLTTPEGQLSPNALRLLGTRFIVARGTLPGYNVVFQDETTGLLVLEDPEVLPRAFFASELERLPDVPAMWERIQSAGFNPARTALVFEGTTVATTPVDSASTARVVLEAFGPREIVWQVETDAPRLLVAGEIYYPAGWKAFVDGTETPIHQVNYLLRGVEVPAGAQQVTMSFEPASYRLSLWLSGLSVLLVYGGVLALLVLGWRRRTVLEAPVSHE